MVNRLSYAFNKAIYLLLKIVFKYKKKKPIKIDYHTWNVNVNQNDHLETGGCDCLELAEKYGTPLYVVDKKKLISNFQSFYKSFQNDTIQTEVYYSYKTNPVPGILKILHDQGAGAEVISFFELWLALNLGVSPNKIIFNGPYKPYKSIESAISHQIKLINIDSFKEIVTIDEIAKNLGKKQDVSIRVSSKWGWTDKFGFKIENGEAFEAYKRCTQKKHIRIRGIHTHLGSGLSNIKAYINAISSMTNLVKDIKEKLGIYIDYFDLGGGFGIATVKNFSLLESLLYKLNVGYPSPPVIENFPTIDVTARRIIKHLGKECSRYNLKTPVLILEPGRVITSSSQLLLLKAEVIKRDKKNLEIAVMNGGINFAYPTKWEFHEIFLANRMSENNHSIYDVAGPLCTPVDVMHKNRIMPQLKENDIVAIMDAGAYFIPFSFNFSFPKPAVVCVEEGRHYLMRHHESFEDMIKLDKII
ncbi:MAG: diaminopimelate decarboxylase family protein [Candidatus Odinarchaeota archaeon]